MVNEHEQGKTTPRIKTGNCSIASTGSSSTAPGADSIYDKQMAWKLHGQRKVRKDALLLVSVEFLCVCVVANRVCG